MFNVKKNFSQDLNAAQTLGISEEAYNTNVDISLNELGALEENVFNPYYPSANVQNAFAENAEKIGMSDPFEGAADAIDSIYEQLATIPLDAAEFPNIENPLVPMDIGTSLNIPGGALNLPNVDANLVANQGGNIPYNQLTTQQKIDILFGRG